MKHELTLKTETEVRAFVALHRLADREAFTPPYESNHDWVAFHDTFGQETITEEEEEAFSDVCFLTGACFCDSKTEVFELMHDLAGACFNIDYEIEDWDEYCRHEREVVDAMVEHQLKRFGLK